MRGEAVWIAAHPDRCALNQRCDVLAVSVGGYRAWQGGGTPDRQGPTAAPLLALIQSIQPKGTYGSPRMVRELSARGCSASKARMERRRREHGTRGRHQRRYQVAIVRDLFNREVVGWSLQPRRTANLVGDALSRGWFRRKPAPGLIHPADRGASMRARRSRPNWPSTAWSAR